MPPRRGENPRDPGIGGVRRHALAPGDPGLRHHDAHAHGAIRRRPVRNGIGYRRICRINRLDQREPAGMRLAHRNRVARVIAVHGEWRHQQRAVDADRIHRRHHLVTGDLRRPVQRRRPWPARMVALIGMHLRVDDGHDVSSRCPD
jgi:hypothetical protein